jgi:hypothetical protein
MPGELVDYQRVPVHCKVPAGNRIDRPAAPSARISARPQPRRSTAPGGQRTRRTPVLGVRCPTCQACRTTRCAGAVSYCTSTSCSTYVITKADDAQGDEMTTPSDTSILLGDRLGPRVCVELLIAVPRAPRRTACCDSRIKLRRASRRRSEGCAAMSTIAWIWIGAAVWIAATLPVALILGAAIRRRDRQLPQPRPGEDDPFTGPAAVDGVRIVERRPFTRSRSRPASQSARGRPGR